MADINSRLPVTDFADGATGTTAPTQASQVGGAYNTTLPSPSNGQLESLQVDSAGRLITSPSNGPSVTGTITALNGTVMTIADGGVIWSITGTWVGTLTSQAQSGDGSWNNVASLSNTTGLFSNSTTVNCDFEMNGAGWMQVRLVATAWTSGTANITVSTTHSSHVLLVYSTNAANFQSTAYLNDGSGNSISSYNTQLDTADIINTSLSSGSITVSTTAVAARVGGSNLSNRKMLMIAPINGIVYLGSSSSVTTSTGIPIFPNVVVSFSFSANVTPYLIAAGSTTVNVFEGS